MKKIVLCSFSGTGNTELTAEAAAEEFTRLGAEVNRYRIEDILNNREPEARECIGEADLLGILHPIYAFGPPGLVKRFIRTLPAGGGTPVFFLRTAADFVRTNIAGTEPDIRYLEKRGYRVIYERLFAMGCNWLIGYENAFIKRLYEVMRERMPGTCADILAGRERRSRFGRLTSLWTRFVNWSEDSIGAPIFGRFLRADAACTNCGICARNCPAGNITMTERGPRFAWKCLSCMRCLYTCPQDAITPGIFRKVKISAGYDVRKIVNDSSIIPKGIDPETRGYFAHFREYLNNPDV